MVGVKKKRGDKIVASMELEAQQGLSLWYLLGISKA